MLAPRNQLPWPNISIVDGAYSWFSPWQGAVLLCESLALARDVRPIPTIYTERKWAMSDSVVDSADAPLPGEIRSRIWRSPIRWQQPNNPNFSENISFTSGDRSNIWKDMAVAESPVDRGARYAVTDGHCRGVKRSVSLRLATHCPAGASALLRSSERLLRSGLGRLALENDRTFIV